MKFAHCGDLHIRQRDKNSTLEEQVATLLHIGRDAASRGAQFILCGGDVFDSKSEPAERQAAIRVFLDWASRMPVVVVRGNHDVPEDLLFLSMLRSTHPIRVLEQPDVLDIVGATVACLPWPRKSHLAALVGPRGDLDAMAAEAMRSILLGMRSKFEAAEGPRILLGHVELGGARMDSGQPVVARPDVYLHEGDLLDTSADVVCLSHIHLHQTLGGGRIVYAGSPRPMTFGEAGTKGYCLIDVERDSTPAVEHRRTPYRELVTVTGAWDGEALVWELDADEVPPGAAVRLVYEVPQSDRAAAAEQALRFANDFDLVKVDARVVASSRVRSEEIKTARTTEDRLRAYWGARGEEPPRAPHIVGKLHTLEEVAP